MRKIYKVGLCSILLATMITQTTFINKQTKAKEKEINNKKEQKRKPNIINIVLDDFGWADTPLNGSEFYETPNMEALAKTGVQFTNSYSGSNLCSPSRAMMLTGRYGARFGMTRLCSPNEQAYQTGINPQTMVPYTYPFTNESFLIEPEPAFMPNSERTIAEQLKSVGYTTAHIGKWHLGDPTKGTGPLDQGFDINIGGNHMGQPRSYFSPYNNPNLSNGPNGEYLTDRLGDEAVKFMNEHKDEPFFLNFAQYAVHTPLQSKKDKIDKYLNKTPSNGQDNAVYAGVIESGDEAIGKIVKAVKDLKLEEDTLIVVTSDNGGLHYWNVTSNAPLKKGKCFNYEGGIRIPTIMSWKGHIKENTVNDTPINQIDFFPTFSEVAGIELPTDRKIDGLSLLPMLTQGIPLNRESLFWYNPHFNPDTKLVLNENPYKPNGQGDDEAVPSAAVRQGDYKLIKNFAPPTYTPDGAEYELYNLKEDIGETKNLADENPDLVKKMAKDIDNWLQDTNAVQPVKTTLNVESKDDIAKLDQGNMSVVASSAMENAGAENVLDGKDQTIWQSQSNLNLPQSITIDLKSLQKIDKLSYQPRMSGTDGNITEYKLYTSTDGLNYNHRVSGTWRNDATLKFANFPAVDAKFIKLRVTAGANQQASAAEINVYEALEADHYDEVMVKTLVGTAPVLPKEVALTYKNGKTANVGVTWEADQQDNYSNVGVYSLEGTITGTQEKISVEVSVEAMKDEASITPIHFGDFDGLQTKYKELPRDANADLGKDFTFDFDVKLNGVNGNWQNLISQTMEGKGLQMNVTPEGYLSVHAYNAITPMNLSRPWISMQSKVKLEKGRWNHVRFSFSADYHKAILYIDDSIVAETVVDNTIETVDLPLSLGAKDTAQHGFNGLLKDIKLYPAFLMKTNTKAITTLDQIMVKGAALDTFDMNTKEYTIQMAETDKMTPVVSATPTDKNAKVSISPSVRIPGEVTLSVHGTDKTTTVYTLRFVYDIVKIDGDFNRDGKVDLSDLGISSKAYGEANVENDINGNGVIDDDEIEYIMNEIFK